MPGRPELNDDEIVSYLKHTKLPTLLVEGSGDKSLLRRIENELTEENIDVMPLGGRDGLHRVYLRRNELKDCQVAFLRDRDEYAVVEPPENWEDYILTNGYSIENDVISREVMCKLAGSETPSLLKVVSLLSEWFRYALCDYVHNGKKADIARDIKFIIDGDNLSQRCIDEISSINLRDTFARLDTEHDNWRWLRGKSLLRAIQHFFSGKDPSYSKDQIIDLSLKLGPPDAFTALLKRIKLKLKIC